MSQYWTEGPRPRLFRSLQSGQQKHQHQWSHLSQSHLTSTAFWINLQRSRRVDVGCSVNLEAPSVIRVSQSSLSRRQRTFIGWGIPVSSREARSSERCWRQLLKRSTFAKLLPMLPKWTLTISTSFKSLATTSLVKKPIRESQVSKP